MNETEQLYENLRMPFDPKHIYWRIGSTNKAKTKGLALAYLDARAVMQRLDETVGINGWKDSIVFDGTGKERIAICVLSIKIGDEWISKTDCAGLTDIEGEKGGPSDALKRAAVKFGVGRYLYYLPSKWVDLSDGRLPPAAQLNKLLPEWATPKGWKKHILGLEEGDRRLTEQEMVEVEKMVNNYRQEKGKSFVNQIIKSLDLGSEWTQKQLDAFVAQMARSQPVE